MAGQNKKRIGLIRIGNVWGGKKKKGHTERPVIEYPNAEGTGTNWAAISHSGKTKKMVAIQAGEVKDSSLNTVNSYAGACHKPGNVQSSQNLGHVTEELLNRIDKAAKR